MLDPLSKAISVLTDIQRQAVSWGEGSLLVLAGPGSGKTQVLTSRIARLLDESRGENFRVLALTFTNKAADEMKGRVAEFVPGLEDRANLGTFHGFCGQILRQHGVHLGIKPDFAIYSADDDRKAILEDALRRGQVEGEPVGTDDVKYLITIDRLKSRLVEPMDASRALADMDDPSTPAIAYRLYEEELRRINAMDFNSLIFEAFRLMSTYPKIARTYRRIYPYWLIDEFQDTNRAQYQLIHTLAGSEFKNIFAVADDDQIIYEWNGANYRQIQLLMSDFDASVIQLPTNYRCPAVIVEAANRLVAYNAHRTVAKKPLIAGKTALKYPVKEHVQLRVFRTEDEEALGIAREIAELGCAQWGTTAILARTRTLLERVNEALHEFHVSSVIAQRRDDFLSAEFRWLVAVMRQLVRPLDRRNAAVLVEAFNRLTGGAISAQQVITDAGATSAGYLVTWLQAASKQPALTPVEARLLSQISSCVDEPGRIAGAVDAIVDELEAQLGHKDDDSDLAEDVAAWKELSFDIGSQIGRAAPLDQFLQELELRSKSPSPRGETVVLMTIHGAKGREFESVYLIGLAEDVMPSFQSRKKGDGSPEMEEERRNCFVAITRTKERLVLSRAETYRGWSKPPSRFLIEMGLVHTDASVA